jgi:dihydrodipicolinate synthase/N-acetylneuraminate lyase
VKAALAMMGRIEPLYRLPLCEPSDKASEQIRATITALGLLAK